MPPNPETINPLMLLNQMIPNAKFEEIGRSGNPPQIMFSFRCTIDDQFFIGSGNDRNFNLNPNYKHKNFKGEN